MKIRFDRPSLSSDIEEATRRTAAAAPSPQQVAAAEAAPWDAATRGLGAAALITELYQRQKDAAVLSDAQAEYETARNEAEFELQNAEYETDDQGNIIEAPGERQLLVERRLQEVEREIDRRLNSRQRREWEQYLNKTGPQDQARRNLYSEERGNNVLTARGELEVNRLEALGDYDSAIAKTEQMTALGLYDPAVGQRKTWELKENRDRAIVFDALSDIDASSAELTALAESLDSEEGGDWPGYMNLSDSTIALDSQERYTMQAKLFSRINEMDRELNDGIEAEQERNYRTLKQQQMAGQLSQSQVFALDINAVSKSRWDDLMSYYDDDTAEVSNQEHLREAREAILDVMFEEQGGSPGEARDAYRDRLRGRGDDGWTLSSEDQIDLSEALDRAIDDVIENPTNRREFQVLADDLGGKTMQQSAFSTTQDRSSEQYATSLAERDFYASAFNDPEFDPREWVKENRTKYFRIALEDTFAQLGVDLDAILMEDGATIDIAALEKIAVDRDKDLTGYTAERKAIRQEKFVEKVLRLWGEAGQ